MRPLNLYGWSKRQLDFVFVDQAARGAALPAACIGLGFFNVFGPNEYHKGDMRSGGALTTHGGHVGKAGSPGAMP